jgi:hypothetical protein
MSLKKKYAYGTCLYLTKAFEYVFHNLLVGELKIYGFDSGNLDLLRSYLDDRYQIVTHNQCNSANFQGGRC